MLLKLLVVIWFLKMLIAPFSKHFIYRTVLKQCGENLKELNISSDTDTKTLSSQDKTKFLGNVMSVLLCLLCQGIVFIIDFVMMLSLIKYDHTYITIVFIGLSILDLVVGLIKAKITNKKNKDRVFKFGDSLIELAKDIEKTTFIKFIMRILNILYWSYALYLLFF